VNRRALHLLTVLITVSTGFVAALLVTAPSALAVDPPPRWCSSVAPPCVESAARDGVSFGPTDATYDVTWPWYNDPGSASTPDDRFYQVVKNTGLGWGYDLGADEIGHVFTINFDLGALVPRVVWGWADPASNPVSRSQSLDGHWHVTLRLTPVQRLSSCLQLPPDFVPTCPHTAAAGDKIEAQIYGDINDASWWGTTAAERDALMGLNSFTNVDYTFEQPDIAIDATTGAATMTIPMANAHEDAAHNTFLGFEKLRLPNRMLREVYGIPAPETMTPDSLASTVSGGVGTIHTWQEAGDDAMHVDVSDVTFSLRRLKVLRGTITPTRPTNVAGHRTADHRARISFAASTPRGARVAGYQVRCTPASGPAVSAVGAGSPVVVTGLVRGRAYSCIVRARSKAGPSRWSAAASVRRQPG
jgi:Fibronectin type III domain